MYAEGLVVAENGMWSNVSWQDLTAVGHTAHRIGFATRYGGVRSLPKSAFASPELVQEFLSLADHYHATAASTVPPPPPMTAEERNNPYAAPRAPLVK